MKRLIVSLVVGLVGLSAFAQTSSEDWILRAENVGEGKYYGVTSANGVVGIISSRDPFTAKEVVLAGVYDHFGRGRVNNFLPNINPLHLSFKFNNEKFDRKKVSNYTQTLDMRTGEFVGNLEYQGTKMSYRYCALRQLSHVVLMEVEITPSADLRLETSLAHKVPQSLHGAVMTANDLMFKLKTEPPFKVITTTALSPTENVKVASSSFFLFEDEDAALPVYHQTPDNDYHNLMFRKDLKAGQTFKFQVIGSLISTAQTADPLNQAERLLTYARFQKRGELMRKHREAWAKLWESDIVIEGDLRAQKEVRSMLYHLYSFSRAGVAHSPSPMGLSGLGYNGHVFWDTEIFMMPPLMLLQPDMALSMLEYRYKLLDEARRNAASYGFAGAMYPWESASTGAEETPATSLSGTFQHHISADIAIGCWNYYLATQDKEWLLSRGWPIIKATAEFWASRCEKGEDGKWHIYNVMCADEFALNVDDNAYTNCAAKRNLEYAVAAAAIVGEKAPELWSEIAEGLFFAKMDNGVTSEHVGYNGANIKQADVNLLAFPHKLITDKEQMLRDLDYYSQKVPQVRTPAMTQSMFSIICTRCGDREQAWKWFLDSYRPNQLPPFGVLAEFKGGTNPYFATGAGGTLQSVLFGFAGLDFNPKGGIMQVKEHALPAHWKSLTIKGVGPEKKTFVIVNK